MYFSPNQYYTVYAYWHGYVFIPTVFKKNTCIQGTELSLKKWISQWEYTPEKIYPQNVCQYCKLKVWQCKREGWETVTANVNEADRTVNKMTYHRKS